MTTIMAMGVIATGTRMAESSRIRHLAEGGRQGESTLSGRDSSGDAPNAAAVQRLFAWLSPAFPVGAFSYSHGLEWSVEDGTISDATTLQEWLAGILRHGAGRMDAVLFAHAYRAATAGDLAGLGEIAGLAAAFQPTKERHRESTAQGRAFLDTVVATWPNATLRSLVTVVAPNEPIAYPVAVALAAAAHNVPLGASIVAYLQAFVANLVSAGVRAIPIGQTDGQRIVAALSPDVREVAGAALADSLAERLDDLGGATLRADIASMKHETQYTRLFRS